MKCTLRAKVQPVTAQAIVLLQMIDSYGVCRGYVAFREERARRALAI